MNMTVKLVKIGNSSGFVVPKEVLSRLRAEMGDEFSLTEGPDGIALHRRSIDFDDQMAVAREVMKKRRVALRELAK